ncbi:MAG: M28 family metallopeptidase [Candidatus Didemnitutus sp.]|nr:M28 family metallopeptidase [Candidatus Didemnitutus sp.]
MKTLLLPLILLAVACGAPVFASGPHISAARILERTKILSSDEFEGRSPGTPGEDKTVEYLVTEFQKLGLAPGNPDGTYVQNVPLVGIITQPTLSFTRDGATIAMENINDFVGPSSRIANSVSAKDTEVVFVGYGIEAPEFGWDDYKGVDVRGKTVVMLINDPPVTDANGQLDPAIFGGKAMTYYGRWTYKYEIAAAKGAVACLIVHETGPAAYPYGVVVGSFSRENFEISALDLNAGKVGMAAWLTLDATRRLFAGCGLDFDAAKLAAVKRDFQPMSLGAKASFTAENTLRNVASRNVVALLPGADPVLKDEYIVFTAHWDHLGIEPKLAGDQIYNGAADNAAGVAVLLELAQAYQALPADQRPKRSLVFLSVTAEEKGLLGSRYYASADPLYPLNRTLANINMDGANQFGPTSDFVVIGHGASTIDDLAAEIAATQGRVVSGDPRPEAGSFYRSDHFEFAKVGVPSFYGKSGRKFIGMPADFADRMVDDYIANRYHKPADEVQPDWTFEGAAQDTALLMELGLRIANGTTWPAWRDGNEFKPKRDAMLAK